MPLLGQREGNREAAVFPTGGTILPRVTSKTMAVGTAGEVFQREKIRGEATSDAAQLDNGIISLHSLRAHLELAGNILSSRQYSEHESLAYTECSDALVRAVNRIADEICGPRTVRKEIVADAFLDLAEVIRSSAPVNG